MPEEVVSVAAKDKTAFAEEQKIMAAHSDTAKTFTQLSLGALVLSITFFEKVLGETGFMSIFLS
jgi:hypothetical protein